MSGTAPLESVRRLGATGVAALLALGASCVARGEGQLLRPTDDDAGPPPPTLIDAGSVSDARFELPVEAPHAVLGVNPPHGAHVGGQVAIVRGNGFASDVRIWFGGAEVPSDDVVAIDPGRAQVVVPPGSAGPTDVVAQNGDDETTRGTLVGGFVYDAFYLDPASGPTSGGTRVTLRGDGTSWDDATRVWVDLEPCPVAEVLGPTELVCVTPKGSPGAKLVRVVTSDDVAVDVLDGFTYGDSDNGFRGGLSGQPIAGSLRVLALDGFTGNVIPGATVIVGDGDDGSLVELTNGAGIALFSDAALGPGQTVTVARKCYQPRTFAEVPVDTVTAYLTPVLSPACAMEGDPPPVGGTPGAGSTITGQLVWEGGVEFKRPEWNNVPAPSSPDERQAAYVLPLSTDPTREFRLPAESVAITPQAPGSIGYEFSVSGGIGNLTLYAIAGIENRKASPPTFTAFALGILKGISTEPGKKKADVFITMDAPLDQAMTLTLTGPKPTARGPDRVVSGVSIAVGDEGYALLPAGQRTSLLPIASPLTFVGVPPLVGSLSGSRYVASARAFTTETDQLPRSVMGSFATTTTSTPVALDAFVEIPVVSSPGDNGQWNGRDLVVSWAPGGAAVDLLVYEVAGSGGLVTWTIAGPPSAKSVRLPDLSTVTGADLPTGAVSITVSAASIPEFDYGQLRYRHLGTQAWQSYAQDVSFAHR